MPLPPAGPKRVYFEIKGGEVDFVEVDQQSYQAIQQEKIAIVADHRKRPCVLNRHALNDLYTLDPKWGYSDEN